MKIEDITIEWGVENQQYFFRLSCGPMMLSGHGTSADEARAIAFRELSVTLESWAQYAMARDAFMAGSGFEPGDAPEAFEKWWRER